MTTTSKTALITAAGSGMGAAIAQRLAADGYRVAVMSYSGKGEALGKQLGGIGFTGSVNDPAGHLMQRAAPPDAKRRPA